MTITAKFPGTCPTCGSAIAPGQKVEWSKGEKARHTDCGAARASHPAASQPAASQPARRSTSRRRGTWTGCSCGSVEEYERPSDCFTCRHDR